MGWEALQDVSDLRPADLRFQVSGSRNEGRSGSPGAWNLKPETLSNREAVVQAISQRGGEDGENSARDYVHDVVISAIDRRDHEADRDGQQPPERIARALERDDHDHDRDHRVTGGKHVELRILQFVERRRDRARHGGRLERNGVAGGQGHARAESGQGEVSLVRNDVGEGECENEAARRRLASPPDDGTKRDRDEVVGQVGHEEEVCEGGTQKPLKLDCRVRVEKPAIRRDQEIIVREGASRDDQGPEALVEDRHERDRIEVDQNPQHGREPIFSPSGGHHDQDARRHEGVARQDARRIGNAAVEPERERGKGGQSQQIQDFEWPRPHGGIYNSIRAAPDGDTSRDRIPAFMKAPTACLFLRALAGCLLLAGTAAGATGAARTPLVVAGRIDTPIHPAAANYLNKLVKGAERDGAELVVLGLSTPGGLLTSTREMVSAILLSKVPVVTFVSPSGASAASAGFFLLLAGDVAAMAPGTNSGAAHPVAGE